MRSAQARREAAAKQRATCRSRREAILERLGRRCARCGFDDARSLQVDHVNGGGRSDRAGKGTSTFYHKVLMSLNAGERKYQLLCANCNWIKRYERGEC